MYELTLAGIDAHDIFSKSGRFCGILARDHRGYKLYWNSSCTKGSKRRFSNAESAIEFMHNRRLSKGLAVS